MRDRPQLRQADHLSGDDLIALARADFAIFVELAFPVLHDSQRMVHAPYIDVIVEVLACSAIGGERNLIFNVPPGYMKSMLISILYTAWRLGVNPAERIIGISYGDDLSHQLSVKTRKLMQSPLYQAIFPETILDKKAEDSITTTRGGQRLATAVGSAIAGFRADLIIIDDPMQPADSTSELSKQKLRDWYYGVVAQRLLDSSKGVIILIMHRLAPDDLTATFVAAGGWLHVLLPLIAVVEETFSDGKDRILMRRVPGELLNPARLSAEGLADLRKTVPPYIFEPQYQQNPQLGGSGACSVDRFGRYAEAPPFELMIHCWDIAATKGGGDWTVCAKFGIARNKEGRDVAYLTGIVRMQIELPDVRAHILAQDALEKPALIIMDGVNIGMGVYQDLVRQGHKHIMPSGSMQRENVEGLKVRRFHTAVQALYDGLVLIPNNMPGLEILLGEFSGFPDGKHDDQVDAVGNVAANLDYVIRVARQHGARMGRQWMAAPAASANAAPGSRDQELHDRRRSRYYDRND